MKMILLGLLLVMSCLCYAADPVALTIKIKGAVSLNRGDDLLELSKGTALFNGDILKSQEDSYAAIKFIDGKAIIKLFPNSNLTIKATREAGKLIKSPYLSYGKIYSKIQKKTGNYVLETPTAVASVKGTGFLTGVDRDGRTALFVTSGVVVIKDKKSGQELRVPANKKVVTTDDGRLVIQDILPGDLDKETMEMVKETADESGMLEIEIEKDGETRSLKIEIE